MNIEEENAESEHKNKNTKKKKSSAAEKKQDEKDKKIFKVIGFTMLLFVVMVAGIIWFKYDKASSGIDARYQEVLDGKESSTGYMYNNYIFVKSDNLWYTRLQAGNALYTVPFHYGPKEVADIPVTGDLKSFGKAVIQNFSRDVYITFDPVGHDLKYVGLANGELSVSIVKTLGFNPIISCTNNESSACSIVPIVTCENNQSIPIISLEQEGAPEVIQDGNCIRLKGNATDIMKSTDRLLFGWYGIIK